MSCRGTVRPSSASTTISSIPESPFFLNDSSTCCVGLLDVSHNVGFGFEVFTGLVIDWLFPQCDIDKQVVGTCHVQQLLGKAFLRLSRLEIVVVLGEILGHGDEFASDLVP